MNRSAKIFLLVVLFACCTAAAMVQYKQWRQREHTRPAELFEVVSRQISAFRDDDFASAYRQVSTDYQEKMNIEAFADQARMDFTAIAQSVRVEFGAVRWDKRHAILPVYFFMHDGEVLPCLYSLIHEEGGWKIDAVRVQKRWPAGQRLGGMRS